MKLLKQKKGISTIIAVLLMIVISVAAAVITYIWITGYLGATTSGIEEQTDQMQINIDTVSVDTTNDNFSVAVRNIGSITATVSAIYVGTSTSNLVAATNISPTLNKDVSTQSVQSFTGDYSAGFTSGTTYYIKVVCSDGQSATTSVTA